MNATIDSLHPNAVLLVLVEVAENLEEVTLWNVRNQLDHVVYDERSTLAYLWNLVLRRLHEKVDDVALVAGRQVDVDDWEELHGCQLRRVGLPVHEPLDHLNYLLPQILHINLLHDALQTSHGLRIKWLIQLATIHSSQLNTIVSNTKNTT